MPISIEKSYPSERHNFISFQNMLIEASPWPLLHPSPRCVQSRCRTHLRCGASVSSTPRTSRTSSASPGERDTADSVPNHKCKVQIAPSLTPVLCTFPSESKQNIKKHVTPPKTCETQSKTLESQSKALSEHRARRPVHTRKLRKHNPKYRTDQNRANVICSLKRNLKTKIFSIGTT